MSEIGLRIALRVPLNASTGYGRDGIGLSRALARAGCDVFLQPSHVSAPLPWDVAQLLTVEPQVPVDVRLDHLPPKELGLTYHDLDTTHKAFAWTMWEFLKFKPDEADEIKARTTGYHKLFVYDETSKAAYESLGSDVPPLTILQGGYDPEEWRLKEGDLERKWDAPTFRFVIAGDLQPRKNPLAAMRVVQRLKDEGYAVELVVKTRHENSFAVDIKKFFSCVTLYHGVWSQDAMRQFYASAHCYIAPSHGEGKNLPAIEAGTTGCAIVASDVGGHRQWAHPVFASLVGGDIVGEYDGLPHLSVDEELLYESCKELVEDRRKAQLMGEQAQQILPQSLSWDRVTRDFLQQVFR